MKKLITINDKEYEIDLKKLVNIELIKHDNIADLYYHVSINNDEVKRLRKMIVNDIESGTDKVH